MFNRHAEADVGNLFCFIKVSKSTKTTLFSSSTHHCFFFFHFDIFFKKSSFPGENAKVVHVFDFKILKIFFGHLIKTHKILKKRYFFLDYNFVIKKYSNISKILGRKLSRKSHENFFFCGEDI